jgi:hypothetical protein
MTFEANPPEAKPLGIFAFIIGLNIQRAIFNYQYRFIWIKAQSDTFKTKSAPSRGICPSLGSKRKSMDGPFVPGLRRGRPDGTNDKLFKPSARTSSRHSSCSEADLKLESRNRRKRAVIAKASTSIPTRLEIPNRSAGKLDVSDLLEYFEIILILATIVLASRLECWNNGVLENWVWRNEIYFQ